MTVLITGIVLIILTPFAVELYYNWKEKLKEEVDKNLKKNINNK